MRGAWLWAILFVAMALRLALLTAAMQDERRAFTPDSRGYWQLAGGMWGQGGPSMPRASRAGARFGSGLTGPEIFRTPGYPAFLLIGRLVPQGGLLGPLGGWRLALAVQVLIDIYLVFLTYSLGRELAGERIGLVAAGLQAICPVAVAASCRILSDSLFALLLTLSVWLIVRHFRKGGWPALLAAAVVLAAACYVRPVGLVMAAIFAAVLLFREKRFRRAGAFVGVVALCIAAWVIRNGVTADYVGFSSFAGESLYRFSAPEVIARTEGISVAQARQRLLADERRHYIDQLERRGEAKAGGSAEPAADPRQVWRALHPVVLEGPTDTAGALEGAVHSDAPAPTAFLLPVSVGSGQRARYRRRRAVEIVAAHPWTYLGIHLKRCLSFWLPGATDVLEAAGCTRGQRGTLAVLHEEGLVAAVRHYFADDTTAIALAGAMALVLLGRYFGAIVCLVRKCRPRMSAAAWLMALLVIGSFLLPGPAAHPRFRVPVAPLLSIAAAVGWVGLIGRFARRKADRRDREAPQIRGSR